MNYKGLICMASVIGLVSGFLMLTAATSLAFIAQEEEARSTLAGVLAIWAFALLVLGGVSVIFSCERKEG